MSAPETTGAAEPQAVLFACTFNRIRSPMAAALLRQVVGDRIFVDSCGLTAEGDEIDPFAAAAMAEIGADLRTHDAKTFDELQDGSFDLVIALSPEAAERARDLTRGAATEVEVWTVDDPSKEGGSREQRMEAFRRTRDDLRRRIEARFG